MENANTFSLSLQPGQYSSQPAPLERVSQHGFGPAQEDTGGPALPARVSQPGTYSSAAEKMMMKMGYKSGKDFGKDFWYQMFLICYIGCNMAR
jgi:hypothetical protein